MTVNELVINQISEECAELQQCISKIQRFGKSSTNPVSGKTNTVEMVCEVNDLVAAIELHYGLEIQEIINREYITAKKEIIKGHINNYRIKLRKYQTIQNKIKIN